MQFTIKATHLFADKLNYKLLIPIIYIFCDVKKRCGPESEDRGDYWEAAKKSSFLSGRATKRGGGLNGCATKEKRTFSLT